MYSYLGLIVTSGLSNWSDIPVAIQKVTVRCMVIFNVCLFVMYAYLWCMHICGVCFLITANAQYFVRGFGYENFYRFTLALSQFLTWRAKPAQPIGKSDVSRWRKKLI